VNNLEEFRRYDTILCIDLKSFFASVECVLRGKNALEHKLLVADETRGDGTIVLATSPALKKYGVPNRCRLYEAKQKAKIAFEIAPPQMQQYINYSRKVINIYLRYVSIEDLFVYSIDEAFLDLTSYGVYYKLPAKKIAAFILRDLREELGLYASCGIGKNMLMAKLCLDIDAKKSKYFIAEWNYESFKKSLWPIKNLRDMWGIGSKIHKKLNKMGFYSIGDIAQANVDLLYKHFGIMGDELYLHANCIDVSRIQDKYLLGERKGYAVGQTLYRDYVNDEIELLLFESCQELAQRLRFAHKATKTVHLSVGYAKQTLKGGIHKQTSLKGATCSAKVLYEAVQKIFHQAYEVDVPVRRLGISVNNLIEFRGEQLSLFDTQNTNYTLDKTIDEIKMKFGKNAILHASSYGSAGTLKLRNKLIGGHQA